MASLEQRIHELPPAAFARSAHAAAKLAIRAAELAGKKPPASALRIRTQSLEQLSAQQRRRLQYEADKIARPQHAAPPAQQSTGESEESGSSE
ncbi:hypothetical protein [Rhodococcus sp. BS-15]|uniref:hypothetical protein n=1 Tax=Rhodococcus sp. BS-15 TaxID=1304954 RepID=UPI000FFCAE87|nr:hypothetical protein [Rhodococcus sp. BS-15]